MDDEEIEKLCKLSGRTFFEHIEQQYGKLVEKVLEYHDIDSYLLLGGANQNSIIDIFEQPNDENSSDHIISLKKEICNFFDKKVTIKVGTTGKLILLLKFAHNIIKKYKKAQLTSQTISNLRSSFSSINSNGSIYDINTNESFELLQKSIMKLLINLKFNIHGTTHENLSVNVFKIDMKNFTDDMVPTCSIECICGHRIKLFYQGNAFQLSNLAKHFKNTSNKLKHVKNSKNYVFDTPEDSNPLAVDDGNVEIGNDVSYINDNQDEITDKKTDKSNDLVLATDKNV